MKNLNRTRIMLLLFSIVFVAPLTAFTLRGGNSFEIFLGKTRAVQQLLYKDKVNETVVVDLSTAAITDDLKVSFNHCGQVGTNRIVSIKDNLQVLKEWKFADVKPDASPLMSIPIKDIAAIQKNLKGKQVSLFYASDLLKEGKVLVMLASGTTQASAQ